MKPLQTAIQFTAISLPLSDKQKACLLHYISDCAVNCFINNNAYHRFEVVREELLLYNCHSITGKLLKKSQKLTSKVTFSHAERLTLTVLLRRNDPNTQQLQIIQSILNNFKTIQWKNLR